MKKLKKSEVTKMLSGVFADLSEQFGCSVNMEEYDRHSGNLTVYKFGDDGWSFAELLALSEAFNTQRIDDIKGSEEYQLGDYTWDHTSPTVVVKDWSV